MNEIDNTVKKKSHHVWIFLKELKAVTTKTCDFYTGYYSKLY